MLLVSTVVLLRNCCLEVCSHMVGPSVLIKQGWERRHWESVKDELFSSKHYIILFPNNDLFSLGGFCRNSCSVVVKPCYKPLLILQQKYLLCTSLRP